MFRLTREVRFALNVDPSAVPASPNGHGGSPAVQGLAHYFTLRVTLAGELDRQSSYLRNIKDVDSQVRALAVPALAKRVAEGGRFTYAGAIGAIAGSLAGAWPGVTVEKLELGLSPYQSVSMLSSEPDMIRLSQKFEFSAAHRLHNPELDAAANRATFGKCNNPLGHGHNYEVQVTLVGTPDAAGVLLPVHEFESIVERHAIDRLDHKFLNLEVDLFQSLNPSVENIAKVIYDMLRQPLAKPHCRLAAVTVWETPKTWAEYAEE